MTMATRSRLALAAVCLSSLMFGLEISSVPVILPTLEAVLHGGFKDIQWVMNAYTIAVTTVLMAVGALADRFGRKRVFVISIIAFGLASLACGLAPDMATLIAARALQGVSGGAMLICQVAILSHQFQTTQERTSAFAAWGVVFGIGLGFGPIIGGGIVALTDWAWVFLIHGPLAVATLGLAVAGVAESRDPDARRLDLWGIATLSAAVFGLAWFITQGPDLGFASPAALGVIGAAAASFVAFLLVERFTPHPMIDFSVFRVRAFSGALLGSMGMNFSFWPFMIYLPIWFQSGLGYDSVTAGLALLTYTLPTLAVPPLAERLAVRFRPGLVIPGGLFTIGVGFLLMRLGAGAAHPGWATMAPGCLVAGVGLGLTNTTVSNTTTASVASARAGMASGIDMSARMISLAVNIALMGFLLVAGITAYLKAAHSGGLDPAAAQALAERIATGDAAQHHSPGVDAAIVHAALTQGFGLVMLYGCLGVSSLAALSFVIFGRSARQAATPGLCGKTAACTAE